MDKAKIMEFADRAYRDMAGAMAVGMADIGTRTGLFRAMAGQGAMRADDLAKTTGLTPRYVEEWCKGMTAAAYLDYDEKADTFSLSAEHAYLLASDGTDHFMGGLFRFAPELLAQSDGVTAAFFHGGGVAFDEFGQGCVHALDLINAGTYEARFASYWLAQMPDVLARLEAGIEVLDVGCGAGRVSRLLAEAFENLRFVGLDPDEASIRTAQKGASRHNLEFVVGDAASLKGRHFDLITACDCIHDFARPVETLRDIRALLAEKGTFFIVEPRASDLLSENIHSIGAMYYGFSIFHCMTQSLAAGGPGLGTCMGPAALGELLDEAGFGQMEDVPAKSLTNGFFRVGHPEVADANS